MLKYRLSLDRFVFSSDMSHHQGSFLVYPIDEEDADKTCQITKGIPANSAIKALVRVYIIKVSSPYSVQMAKSTIVDPSLQIIQNAFQRTPSSSRPED